ncbi:MAG: ABC transporter substrate-binding protein [Rhodospirillales bacterium]
MVRFVHLAVATAAAVGFAVPSFAADKVRLIISTQQSFELFAPEQALAEGYFAKEGLDVSIIYGDGGAATMQTIITGSQDVVTGVGTSAVVAAFAKGAPVRIIGNGKRGPGPVVWYVPTASPIKSLKDMDGKTLAFSRPGSTTHTAAQFMLKESGVKAKLVSVGGTAASRTQVMSGQVDTGWTIPPANFDLMVKGEARVIADADKETPELNNVPIRVMAANSDWLAKNPDVARRFVKAVWKGIVFNHTQPEPAVRRYAEKWKMDYEMAKAAPRYLSIESQAPNQLGDIEMLERMAVEDKMIAAPLTAEQRKQLIQIVYDPLKD